MLKCVQLQIDGVLLFDKFSLFIYSQQQISVVLTVVIHFFLGYKIAVFSNNGGLFLVTSLKRDWVDSCEWLRNDCNQQVKHDDHVNYSANYEEYPHVWDRNLSKCCRIKITQYHSINKCDRTKLSTLNKLLPFSVWGRYALHGIPKCNKCEQQNKHEMSHVIYHLNNDSDQIACRLENPEEVKKF